MALRAASRKRPEAQAALLALGLGFHSWRTLTRDAALKQPDAVAAMVRAIVG